MPGVLPSVRIPFALVRASVQSQPLGPLWAWRRPPPFHRISPLYSRGTRYLVELGPRSVRGIVPGTAHGIVPGTVCGTVPGAVCGTVPGAVCGTVPGAVRGTVPGTVKEEIHPSLRMRTHSTGMPMAHRGLLGTGAVPGAGKGGRHPSAVVGAVRTRHSGVLLVHQGLAGHQRTAQRPCTVSGPAGGQELTEQKPMEQGFRARWHRHQPGTPVAHRGPRVQVHRQAELPLHVHRQGVGSQGTGAKLGRVSVVPGGTPRGSVWGAPLAHRTGGPFAVQLRPRGSAFCSPSPASSAPPARDSAATRKPGKKRRRLDEVCMGLYPQHSRSLLQSWIMRGKVLVDGQPVTKAGTAVKPGARIELLAKPPRYVCRAGYKLEGALDAFGLEVSGRVALDAGLSTGGFTDCLLQRGVRRVYGVDVGYGQVAERIRTDERVVVMERTNLRYLEALPEAVDLVTLDLSFISLLLVMPVVLPLCTADAQIVTLIKPQFEARRDQVGGGGIVRSAGARQEIVQGVLKGLQQQGLQLEACTCSPITGTDGNIEYLAWFKRVLNGEGSEPQAGSAESLPASFFESVDVSLVYRRQGGAMVLMEPKVRSLGMDGTEGDVPDSTEGDVPDDSTEQTGVTERMT